MSVQTAGHDADRCGLRRKIDARMCVPFSEGKTDRWQQSNVLTCAAHQILRRYKDIVFDILSVKFF